nr:PREDICTED: uncharacterized protein At1g24485-like isoform X2 [Daucus carota subsp. sativus]
MLCSHYSSSHMMAKHFISLLILGLCNFLVSADVYWYIDCGSTSTAFYTDSFINVWQGDGDLIQNGVPRRVQSSTADSDPVMDTLRVFTTRKKNCYAFNADKGGRVLVRASFKYGNYDGKSSPPTFDLHFDGNFWTTVETSIDEVVTYEATYVVKGDVVSVCVAQTKPNQFPFISALVIRSMDSNMYSNADPSYALFLKSRVAYGAETVIRLSTDYDRIWLPAILENGQDNITGDALYFAITLADSPPIEVLQNAITTASTSDKLILASGFPSDVVSVYLTTYFSEPTEVTETRSFKLYIDNQASSESIIPAYEVAQETVGNLNVSSNSTLSLVATSDSVLPPLINAMELFYVGKDQLTDGTNSDDSLALLQQTFTDLKDWYGDPCLPSSFTWDWLDCSNDATPRVTALHLGTFDLTGSLPDISSMTSLQTIDLHNNSLTGAIPDSLGTLPNLKALNLADNQLSGSIPTSLSSNKNIKLDVTGNPDLCTSGKSCDATTTSNTDTPGFPTISDSPSTGKKKNKKTPLILGTTIPSGLLASALISIYAWMRHKRKKPSVPPTQHAASGHGGGGNVVENILDEIKVNMEDQIIQQVSNGISQQAQDYIANSSTT